MTKKRKEESAVSKILSNSYVKAIGAMIGISLLSVALVLFGLNMYTRHGQAVAVPSVIGMQVEEAAAILKKASLDYEIVDSVYLTDGIPGAITDQVPEEASNVKEGRIIFLSMQAKNVELIAIPALKDVSQRQAVATLNSRGFINVTINEVVSAYKGLVIDITYKGKTVVANEKIPKGAPITLTVGAGGEVVMDSIIDYIPDMNNQDYVEEDYHEGDQNDADTSVDNSFFE